MHTEGEIADAIKRLRTAGVDLEGGIFNGVPPKARLRPRLCGRA